MIQSGSIGDWHNTPFFLYGVERGLMWFLAAFLSFLDRHAYPVPLSLGRTGLTCASCVLSNTSSLLFPWGSGVYPSIPSEGRMKEGTHPVLPRHPELTPRTGSPEAVLRPGFKRHHVQTRPHAFWSFPPSDGVGEGGDPRDSSFSSLAVPLGTPTHPPLRGGAVLTSASS